MNKKILLITVLLLLVVLGVAAAVYPRLSSQMQPQEIATVPTDTTAATESMPTETTVPETTEPVPTETTEPAAIAAPDFTVLDWDGNEAKLSDYFGKPIVLNFWAHWCGPCQMEMPEFNAKWEELGGEVIFLMVHMGAAVDEGKAKVTEGGYTFPVLFDTQDAAGGIYGISAYPTSFFIDTDGNLKAYYVGAMDTALLQQGIDLIYTP